MRRLANVTVWLVVLGLLGVVAWMGRKTERPWERASGVESHAATNLEWAALPESLGRRPYLPPGGVERAARILEDRFTLQGITATQDRRRDGGLDWHHRGPRGDKEWAWMLNRHFWFHDLAEAYRVTGDPAYRERLNQDLRDWIRSNPPPRGWSFSPSWRPLEAARRVMDTWIPLFRGEGGAGLLEAETVPLVERSLRDHGHVLRKYASFWGGNHYVTEKLGLMRLALAFPEFPESEEWKDHAHASLRDQFLGQVYPDGAYKELSNHYQRIVLEHGVHLLELLDLAGLRDPALTQGVQMMAGAFHGVTRPSGFGPLNNGSDLESNRSVLERLGASPHLSAWEAPVGFFYLPWAGQAVFRSDQPESSHWAFFEVGPHGTAHQHHDRLHLSLSAYGQDFLVDGGRYHYLPGKWNRYFTGPHAHNIVLLDGTHAIPPPRRVHRPLPVRVERMEKGDWVAAENRYRIGHARHRRGVYYHHDKAWLVVDAILQFGPREAEFLWRFHPDCRVEVSRDAIVARSENDAALILLTDRSAFSEIATWMGEEGPEPRGWYSAAYNEKVPATEMVFRHRFRGPTFVLWWFVPVGPGEPIPDLTVPRIVSADFDRVLVEITLPSGTAERIELDLRPQARH